MNTLCLDMSEDSIFFCEDTISSYGIVGRYYFYIEKNKKKNDKLIFSIEDCSENIKLEIYELNLTFIDDIDQEGNISLNIEYIFLKDEELLNILKTIAYIFKKYRTKQPCEISKSNENIAIYNLEHIIFIELVD